MKNKMFHFDKVKIRLRYNTGFVANRVNLKLLENICSEVKLCSTTKIEQIKSGYESRLELTAPSVQALEELKQFEEFLEEFAKQNSFKGITHSVNYVEIVRDYPCETELMAKSKAKELMECVRMMNARKFYVYDVKKSGDSIPTKFSSGLKKKSSSALTKSSSKGTGLFSDLTCYWGGDKSAIKFVIYPRISKVTGCPVVHTEFRIRGSDKVRKLLGIRGIADMLTCNIEDRFEALKYRFIRFEKINYEALVNFWLNMRKGAKSSGIIKTGKRAGEKRIEPEKLCQNLRRAFELDFAGNLRNYFMKKKKEIKGMIAKGKVITAHQKRIVNTTLESFFIPISDPLL